MLRLHYAPLSMTNNEKLFGTFTEWRDINGFMRIKLPHRQEGTYELEDTALAAKENKNCI